MLLLLFLIGCGNGIKSSATQVTKDSSLERIYNSDPYRKYIGIELENHVFSDVITGK